jgi:hypothetical protein
MLLPNPVNFGFKKQCESKLYAYYSRDFSRGAIILEVFPLKGHYVTYYSATKKLKSFSHRDGKPMSSLLDFLLGCQVRFLKYDIKKAEQSAYEANQ